MRAAAGVLAAGAGEAAGEALGGPAVADDAQPARRAIMMRAAASTGISPIRQARCRALQGIGGEWRVTGVSLEEPGKLVAADMCACINSPRLCPSPRQWVGWSSAIQGACSSTMRRVA